MYRMIRKKQIHGIILDKKLSIKKTARCPYRYLGHDVNGEKYIILIGKTETQKFYLERAVESQRYFQQTYESNFKINMPVFIERHKTEIIVGYKYFEKNICAIGENPPNELLKLHNSYAKEYQVNDELICQIEIDFLNAWPQKFHKKIRELIEYREYFNLISNKEKIQICFEHGDFATNNILITSDGSFWIMDFEFFKRFQPIGGDFYDWYSSIGKKYIGLPNLEINICKQKLMYEINNLLDSNK